MKIKREELLDVVNTIYKGVGNNKIIPITQMLCVKFENNTLTLAATDSTNYISGKLKVEDNDESFSVCVNADLFVKLVNKFTTEFVRLTLTTKSLKVSGDGNYELEILLDDDGNIFAFPIKEYKAVDNEVELKVDDFVNLKTQGEKSLAQTMENPVLINYYAGEKIISTDTLVMTVNDNPFFKDAKLLSAKFVNLLTLMKDKVKLSFEKDKIYATDKNIDLVTTMNFSIEDYPVEAINDLLANSEFNNEVKIKVNELNAVLDRLSLFVTQYDDGIINLKFDNNTLFASTLKSQGVEMIKLDSKEPVEPFICGVDIEMLKNQLASFTEETINLSFGNDTFIKLSSGNISKLISLTEN